MVIAASVPTGRVWYGYYKFSVEEELFRDELATTGFATGCGGYGTAYGNGDFSESLRAHIEDVVVDQSTRGTGLGAKLIKALVDIARQTQCRTAVLNCKEDNVGFYLKCGFVRTGKVCMSIYFDEATAAPPTA